MADVQPGSGQPRKLSGPRATTDMTDLLGRRFSEPLAALIARLNLMSKDAAFTQTMVAEHLAERAVEANPDQPGLPFLRRNPERGSWELDAVKARRYMSGELSPRDKVTVPRPAVVTAYAELYAARTGQDPKRVRRELMDLLHAAQPAGNAKRDAAVRQSKTRELEQLKERHEEKIEQLGKQVDELVGLTRQQAQQLDRRDDEIHELRAELQSKIIDVDALRRVLEQTQAETEEAHKRAARARADADRASTAPSRPSQQAVDDDFARMVDGLDVSAPGGQLILAGAGDARDVELADNLPVSLSGSADGSSGCPEPASVNPSTDVVVPSQSRPRHDDSPAPCEPRAVHETGSPDAEPMSVLARLGLAAAAVFVLALCGSAVFMDHDQTSDLTFAEGDAPDHRVGFAHPQSAVPPPEWDEWDLRGESRDIRATYHRPSSRLEVQPPTTLRARLGVSDSKCPAVVNWELTLDGASVGTGKLTIGGAEKEQGRAAEVKNIPVAEPFSDRVVTLHASRADDHPCAVTLRLDALYLFHPAR